MKLTFLGTGTSLGVPVIGSKEPVSFSNDPRDERSRTSALIQTQGRNIVIDSGPDFRRQMLDNNVESLDGILLTHEHRDHIAGLDDVRPFYFHQDDPVLIHANEQVWKAMQKTFYYLFEDEKYPTVPDLELVHIENSPFQVRGVTVEPIQVMHYKMPVLGFRIGDLTYITDANHISSEEKEKIKGSKVLVLNALRKTPHISHFNLEEAIEVAEELGAERTYFTHISEYMGFHAEVEKELPPGIHLAYDGLTVEI